jgi:IS5 family transposase
MFFEGIRSERQLMNMVAMRLDCHWFIGYDLNENVPDHSSLTYIRNRFGLEVFQRFFEEIVELCIDAGLVWGQEMHFDGTMVRANAAYSNQVPRFYQQAQQHLEAVFNESEQDERGLVSKYDGTQQLVRPNRHRKRSDYWVSPVDETATTLGREQLGYHLHYAIDGGKSRIILNCLVTPATVQDNMPMLDVAWLTRFRWQLHLDRIVADRRYGTIENVVGVEQNGVQAFMPLHSEAARASGKKKTLPSNQFRYDAKHNQYICPQGEILYFYANDHHSQRVVYKAHDEVCNACPIKTQCASGKSGRRINHSMFKNFLDRVKAYQETEAYQKAMRKRQVWVEPKFAEVKQWHQGEKFRLRGLFKVNIEALLRAAGQNIKQLLKPKTQKNRPKPTANAAMIRLFSSYNRVVSGL